MRQTEEMQNKRYTREERKIINYGSESERQRIAKLSYTFYFTAGGHSHHLFKAPLFDHAGFFFFFSVDRKKKKDLVMLSKWRYSLTNSRKGILP